MMHWVIRTIGGAVLTGVGLKVGAEVYEIAKKRFGLGDGEAQAKKKDGDEADETTAQGAAATAASDPGSE